MNAARKRKLRLWTFIAFGAVILLGGYAFEQSHRRSLGRLAGFLGFDLPPETQLSDYSDDYALFDFSQSWLVQFPAGAARAWESSGSFHECLPQPNPGDDYSYIRSIVHADFPGSIPRFHHPRIWRGGHDGNCYVASSDDGSLVFFHYFTT